jgi:spore maturation protein CgeB
MQLDIVFIGLSITSSWGNGHATTYRGLLRELRARGHRVTFLERDVPWYAGHRDLPQPPYAETFLYGSLDQLQSEHELRVRDADVVVVGSYVPEGIAVGEWATKVAHGVRAFYDIDTPVTLAQLESGSCDYLTATLVAKYDLYLSFTGGPTLHRIESRYGAPTARPLYCSFDPEHYFPEESERRWDLGYLGTYSDDRQPKLETLLLSPAKQWPEARFAVAGPQYPEEIAWPANVQRFEHLPPESHRRFYNEQRFTLNVTREAMVRAGYSPSVRLFEAAACATPIISDNWPGLDELFRPESEILIASSASEVLHILRNTGESDRAAIGSRARERVLSAHTAADRAAELESYAAAIMNRTASA